LRLVDSVLADTAGLSLDDSRVLDGALVEVYESDLTDAEAAEVAYHLIGQAMAADLGEVDVSPATLAVLRDRRAQ